MSRTPPADDRENPGRYGATATVQVAARSVGRVRVAYNPVTDGRADPGEIVWTWVPYEENDGRGKDRPVLIVASAPDGSLLGLQLTSKPHDDQWDVPVGTGPWDTAGRPSWVRLERVFRLQQGGIRRSGVALDARRFALVAAALSRTFGWTADGAAAPAPAPAPASSRTPTPARRPAPTRQPTPPRRPAPARKPAPASARTPAPGSARQPAGGSMLARLLRRLFPPRG